MSGRSVPTSHQSVLEPFHAALEWTNTDQASRGALGNTDSSRAALSIERRAPSASAAAKVQFQTDALFEPLETAAPGDPKAGRAGVPPWTHRGAHLQLSPRRELETHWEP